MVDFSFGKDLKKAGHIASDAGKAAEFVNDLSDVDDDGIPEIPTFSGENKWLKTGTDLVNTGVTVAAIIACPEDPMLWIQGAIDVVKDIGDIFSDFFSGDDDESEEESSSAEGNPLENALESKELYNKQEEYASKEAHMEASEAIKDSIGEDFESEMRTAMEQAEDGTLEAPESHEGNGESGDDFEDDMFDSIFSADTLALLLGF